MRFSSSQSRGFSLVEVLIVTAISLLIFGGLFASFQYSLRLIGETRAKMTALALITDRLEYVRSLPYDDVGTVLGIPSGAIPQYRVINLNGLDLYERVLIEYVDDPADGEGVLDSNGVLSDYKRIKIEYEWNTSGASSSFSIASSIVPRSIETNSGGGTIRVNVFDAEVQPLQGMSVRLFNASTTSPVDVTRSTDATGAALFTGAPAGSGYELFVTSPGYSSDQTYQATTSLPFPTTLPVAVLEGDVSTMNFQIDRLSTSTFRFVENQVFDTVVEAFADASGIATTTAATVTGGELVLTDTAGVYEPSGEAWLEPISPSPLASWGVVKLETALMAQTSARVHFYTSTSTSDIIPDSDLPGNSTGFVTNVIDLRALDVVEYDTLVPRLVLSTADTNVTPRVLSLEHTYLESEDELSAESVTVYSTKTIGTDASATPIPKFSLSTTTTSAGSVLLTNLEWGGYVVTSPSYVVESACPANPTTIAANSISTSTFALSGITANTLRVAVEDSAGLDIMGATVELTRGGTTYTDVTDWCGQAFFSGLVADTNYRLEVSKTDYTTSITDPFDISGQRTQDIILAE